MTTGITARGWGWRHAGASTWAVRGLDLEIAPGERVLLIGDSGSGKSTVLAGMAGLLGSAEDGAAEGSMTVGDAPAHTVRGRVGLVLQEPDSQVILARVGDDIAFGMENLLVPREEIWPRVEAAKQRVGLGHLPNDHPTHQLSGGQKQRLALAGVLAMRPGALLLDEPTANLDPAGAAEIAETASALAAADGLTMVVVEHRVDLWAPHVDRVLLLERTESGSRIAADGAPTNPAIAALLRARRPHADRRPAPTPGRVLVEAQDLAVGWDAKRPPVASGINFSLRAGECLAVLGPNGAGKSTLALTVAGLLPPLAGRIQPDAAAMKSAELIQRIGTVMQEPALQFVERSVRAEIEVGPRAAGLDQPERIAERLMAALRLTHLADRNPHELSGGEQRRLSVAAVLATAPEVIVLDEPTFGQDPETWAELVAIVQGLLDAGHAVLAVTHDTEFVAAVADRTLTLGAA